MLPEEVFKRRHRGTPESFSLIIVNTIILALIGPGFIKCHHIGLVFWIGLAGLALYNIYTVRRNRENFDKAAMIAYILSVVVFAVIIILLATRDC